MDTTTTTSIPMMTMPVTPTGSTIADNGFNGWMNNPFSYLIWIYALRWMGFNGNGVDAATSAATAANALTSSQIDSIRSGVAGIASAIENNDANSMRFLEQIANECRANGVAIGDVKTAVLSQLTNMQYQTSQQISEVVSAISSCCCATQNKIESAANQLSNDILTSTNTPNTSLLNMNTAVQLGQKDTQSAVSTAATQIGNGLSQLGYAIQGNQAEMKQLIAQEGCQTRQLMRDLHTEDIIATKDASIAALQNQVAQYSQEAQTATILAAIGKQS